MNPVREILVLYTIDTTGVEQGIKKSTGLIHALKGELKSLVSVLVDSVEFLVSFGHELILEADALSTLASTLGLATAELQGWQWAAQSSGVEASKLTDVVRKLQEAAGDPLKAEAFSKYKIELRDANGSVLSTNQLLERTADVLSEIENPSERAAAAMDLFGSESASLLPLLGKSSEEIAALRKEVEELGTAFSEDFVNASAKVNSNIERIKATFRGLMTQGLELLLPIVEKLTDVALGLATGFARMVRSVGRAIKDFVNFIKETKLVQAVITMLSVKGIGPLIRLIGMVITGMGGLRAIVSSLLSIIGRLIVMGIVALRGAILRLLPLLWKVILPMLAIEDFLVFLSGGKSVFGEALDGIFGGGAAEKFRDAISEIFQLLKDGKIGEALMKTFSGLGDMFAAMGRLVMSLFVKAWNLFVEKSGRMAKLLGLEKIDENKNDSTPIPYNREREAMIRRLSGRETDAERAARERFIPGHSQVKAHLEAMGLFTNGPQLTPSGDGIAALSHAIDASNNWVESQQSPGLMIPSAFDQNVENHVSIENRITVQVPPGEGDLGGRVGRAAAQGAAQSFDVRAIQAALVPQPAK